MNQWLEETCGPAPSRMGAGREGRFGGEAWTRPGGIGTRLETLETPSPIWCVLAGLIWVDHFDLWPWQTMNLLARASGFVSAKVWPSGAQCI